jgi:hypothetical protein
MPACRVDTKVLELLLKFEVDHIGAFPILLNREDQPMFVALRWREVVGELLAAQHSLLLVQDDDLIGIIANG